MVTFLSLCFLIDEMGVMHPPHACGALRRCDLIYKVPRSGGFEFSQCLWEPKTIYFFKGCINAKTGGSPCVACRASTASRSPSPGGPRRALRHSREDAEAGVPGREDSLWAEVSSGLWPVTPPARASIS